MEKTSDVIRDILTIVGILKRADPRSSYLNKCELLHLRAWLEVKRNEEQSKKS